VGVVDVIGIVALMTGVLVSAVLTGAFVTFVVVLVPGGLAALLGLLAVTDFVTFVEGTAVVPSLGVSWGWIELAVIPFIAAETIVGFMVVGTVVGLLVAIVLTAAVTAVVWVVRAVVTMGEYEKVKIIQLKQ